MAFGSITTDTTITSSAETFLPVAGIVLASAFSTAHVTLDVDYTSGNTGTATIKVYSSLGSGAFSATTEWDDTPILTYSLVSTTDPNQTAFALSGYYAVRCGIANSSNSTININMGWRID